MKTSKASNKIAKPNEVKIVCTRPIKNESHLTYEELADPLEEHASNLQEIVDFQQKIIERKCK